MKLRSLLGLETWKSEKHLNLKWNRSHAYSYFSGVSCWNYFAILMIFGSLKHLELYKNSCFECCRQYTVIAYDCMSSKKKKRWKQLYLKFKWKNFPKQLKFTFGLMEYWYMINQSLKNTRRSYCVSVAREQTQRVCF